MLPTKGYFQDIQCPYFENGCSRPYCHFMHRRLRGPEAPAVAAATAAAAADNDEVAGAQPREAAAPTYRPTPKTELAGIRSHIPISYVPDLAVRPPSTQHRALKPLPKFNFEQPKAAAAPPEPQATYTYNPTPLSILSAATSSYSPLDEDSDDGNCASITAEKYPITGDVVRQPVDADDLQYNPESNINFEELSAEFDLIGGIIGEDVDVDVGPEPEGEEKDVAAVAAAAAAPPPPKQKSRSEDEDSKTKERYKDVKQYGNSRKRDKKVKDKDSRSGDKERSSDREKTSDKEKEKKDKDKEKHRKEQDKDKKKVKPDKDRDSGKKEKTREKSKPPETDKDKARKEKDKDKDRKKEREKEKSRDEEKKKKKEEEEKKKKEGKRKKEKQKEKSESKEQKESGRSSGGKKAAEHTKDKDKDRRKSSSKSKDRDNDKRHKEREKRQDKAAKPSRKYSITSSSSSSEGNDASITENYEITNNIPDHFEDVIEEELLEEEEEEDEDTIMECYKIFNEYKPPEPEQRRRHPPPPETDEAGANSSEDDFIANRKRVAHLGAVPGVPEPKTYHTKHKAQPSPAMVMANRFKVAKIAQASNEQRLLANAMKRPAPTMLQMARQAKMQKLQQHHQQQQHHTTTTAASSAKESPAVSSSTQNGCHLPSQFIMGGGTAPKRRVIAPVLNINSIQREKAKLDELNRKKAADALAGKTAAQNVKGAKRVAHVPEFSLGDIPDVLGAEKSKIPVNVRTRFLTLMADECMKLYLIKEEAYTRALNEEYACYEKCKAIMTYRNSAMLAVNRLRKEMQERDKMGLGALGAGETSHKAANSQFSGKTFYDNIRKWVLTDEELDIHGYPKESAVRGRAVIKCPRPKPRYALADANRRKCARCSKTYAVDDDGRVVYPEECVYHPLKKRIIRGEHIYLCCKSNDESGCTTSHTHVSEMDDEAELEGYQVTMPPTSDGDPKSHAVYALDCEMCYTVRGLELTRVTVVDVDCKTVYESLVKPLNPIIDYNTQFSGITADQMERTSTSILQVQANILHLCNSDTILIGHSLESDMKALKIVHGRIIDTSVMFPHKMGLPYKRALRVLASEHLKKIIQNGVSGHDSAEDAVTCMELVKWKLREELKVRSHK